MKLAKKVVEILKSRGLKVSCAESCTGGLVAAEIISVPGSSEVIDCAFVTYSNEAKTKLIGVPEEDIKEFGAVSEVVARKMALGAKKASGADIGVSATGIAGPGGGTEEKPVGLVYVAIAGDNRVLCKKLYIKGSRSKVRKKATEEILKLILKEALI